MDMAFLDLLSISIPFEFQLFAEGIWLFWISGTSYRESNNLECSNARYSGVDSYGLSTLLQLR